MNDNKSNPNADKPQGAGQPVIAHNQKRENGVLVYSSMVKIHDPDTGQVLVQMRCN